MEVLRLQDFRPDVRWVARVLGLSIDEVNVALQRLLRLGLLSMDEPDCWTDRTGDSTASVRGFTRAALQSFIDQSRARLLEAFGDPKARQCAYSTTTLAVSAGRAGEFVEKIDRFRRDLLALLREGEPAEDLYQLEITFVPLTRRITHGEGSWDNQ
ncbi:MAG: DUF4423 domain-containing protein [Gemmataceae bacterium]